MHMCCIVELIKHSSEYVKEVTELLKSQKLVQGTTNQSNRLYIQKPYIHHSVLHVAKIR